MLSHAICGHGTFWDTVLQPFYYDQPQAKQSFLFFARHGPDMWQISKGLPPL